MTVEQPGELGVRGHVRLYEQRRALGVNTGGQIQTQEFVASLSQRGRILTHRDRVHIREHEQAVVGVLHGHPVLERADIVAQRQRARGLNAG